MLCDLFLQAIVLTSFCGWLSWFEWLRDARCPRHATSVSKWHLFFVFPEKNKIAGIWDSYLLKIMIFKTGSLHVHREFSNVYHYTPNIQRFANSQFILSNQFSEEKKMGSGNGITESWSNDVLASTGLDW